MNIQPSPMDSSSLELNACHPRPVNIESFNPVARLPYGLTIEHLCTAMNAYIHCIGFVNRQLHGRSIPRLETILMSATFSSMIGEFMASTIPKHCQTIARNGYHNGHPDLVPKGTFPNDTVQYAREGIEVKSSRYLRGWQGHNAEGVYLLKASQSQTRLMPVFIGVSGFGIFTFNRWDH